ncbi:MAG: hypothetical protein JNN05_09260 [Candidatus Omnitrophica bacterium]|nr:hypothetical protein [Candidatus Omnitrophota bacterium]
MKSKKNNKIEKKKSVPLIKSLGEMMKDEDGFVSKENILKVGLSTVAALGVSSALSEMSSSQVSHNNTVVPHSPPDTCVDHTNITTHTSY